MVFVQRNEDGDIVGVLRRELSDAEAASGLWQPVTDTDADVAQFARRLGETAEANPLALTDADLARVTEDLIDVLIDRAVIQFTDLPVAAQNKLLQRRQTRASLARRLDLLGSDDTL